MSLIKVAWYVLWVKNMHFGSPSNPSQTAAAKAKPRYVYSILKPHGQSSGNIVTPSGSITLVLPNFDLILQCFILSPCRSQAVVCVSTPRKYPSSGYFLVSYYFAKYVSLSIWSTGIIIELVKVWLFHGDSHLKVWLINFKYPYQDKFKE